MWVKKEYTITTELKLSYQRHWRGCTKDKEPTILYNCDHRFLQFVSVRKYRTLRYYFLSFFSKANYLMLFLKLFAR